MKNVFVKSSRNLLRNNLIALSICATFCIQNGVSSAEIDPEMLIVPGKALGLIKLGSKPEEVHSAFASCDGKYDLQDGYKAEFYKWKEPKKTYYVRVYYSPSGSVVQVSSQGIEPETAEHITIKSTLADVQSQYKSLKTTTYRGKHGLVDYFDDVDQGICFEFAGARSKDARDRKLFALIVHEPGKPVMPEPVEKIEHSANAKKEASVKSH